MNTTPTPTTARARSHRGWPHLRPPLRKAVLVAHLFSAGAWVGIDVLVAVLVLVGWFGQGSTAGLAYRALGTFVAVPMLMAALVCLATGLLLGLASRWGLVRYWWVLVKLVLTLVLCVLIVVALQPQMPDVVAHGEAVSRSTGVGSTGSRVEVIWLFFPPTVSLTVLGLATGLAVYKPWGRLPGRRR